jgi:hypothetical protein
MFSKKIINKKIMIKTLDFQDIFFNKRDSSGKLAQKTSHD